MLKKIHYDTQTKWLSDKELVILIRLLKKDNL